MRQNGLNTRPELDFYMPIEHWAAGGDDHGVRSTRDPALLEPELNRALAKVDATAPISRVQTMEKVVRTSRRLSRRPTTILLAGFAAVALVLARSCVRSCSPKGVPSEGGRSESAGHRRGRGRRALGSWWRRAAAS